MQGQHGEQRVLFDTFDLEQVVHVDHLPRRVDQRVSRDFISDATRELYCADNGRLPCGTMLGISLMPSAAINA